MNNKYLYKKFALSFLFSLTILFCHISKSHAGKYGTGEIKLSNAVVNYFIQYIRGAQHKYPADFYVTIDGSNALYWFCAEMTNCSEGSLVSDLAKCLQVTGKQCKKFARKRTIRWKNDINPGKGKKSKISTKLTDQEIRNRLRELGFIE